MCSLQVGREWKVSHSYTIAALGAEAWLSTSILSYKTLCGFKGYLYRTRVLGTGTREYPPSSWETSCSSFWSRHWTLLSYTAFLSSLPNLPSSSLLSHHHPKNPSFYCLLNLINLAICILCTYMKDNKHWGMKWFYLPLSYLCIFNFTVGSLMIPNNSCSHIPNQQYSTSLSLVSSKNIYWATSKLSAFMV